MAIASSCTFFALRWVLTSTMWAPGCRDSMLTAVAARSMGQVASIAVAGGAATAWPCLVGPEKEEAREANELALLRVVEAVEAGESGGTGLHGWNCKNHQTHQC